MASSTARKLAVVRPATGGDKRDAILRAATKVFAQRGFFQSQVADVARVAGVAAGTVYLYFKGKDDLLVSIFERSMGEVLADGRAAVVCGAWRTCISDGSAAIATSPSSSRSSCGSR
jgi:AcrR family transcriptional regulator